MLGRIMKGAAGWGSAARAAWGRTGGMGRAAVYGAGAGGIYGAFSDDTSVLGGMMGGAALGAGGVYGARIARNPAVRKAWSTAAGGWRGTGPILAGGRAAGGVIGRDVMKFGTTLTTGYNTFKAMMRGGGGVI